MTHRLFSTILMATYLVAFLILALDLFVWR